MLTLHYEARFGLARGAVYKDGLPHLYMEGYAHDPSLAVLGTRSVARLKTTAGGVHFVTLADGGDDAVLDAPQSVRLDDGLAVEIEIVAEARLDKRARARFLSIGHGDLRRLSPVTSLKDRLLGRAHAIFGDMGLVEGADRDALERAFEQACHPSGPLAGGGDLSVDLTRGLIACDVDAGGDHGVLTPRAFARRCNERAVADLPRRLRLSGLAGLVVVDLIGQRHDGERLRHLLLDGFGNEADRIIVAPIGKFGTVEFVRPWGACPACDFTPMAMAVSLIWQALGLSEADRGRPIALGARDDTIAILRPLLAGALDPLAPMLRLEASPVIRAAYA